ncbi:hypothetical protein [Megasphaera stantonii]|uniref:hypothetical protein n=1 Tax=Megasphaera stantonii TaxID=2144175 RepID=UPI000D176721|nr:hypothetical protein [Megasphaera stantonii]
MVAVTDKEKGTRGGMTAFLIRRDTSGFSVSKTEVKMGIRGAVVSRLICTDCAVPESCVLGRVGDAFKVAMSCLDGGRIGIAAPSLGVA